MSKSIGFVAELGVRDVQRAVQFYIGALGCELVDQVADEHGVAFWAEVSLADTRLMFQRADMLSNELPGISGDIGKPRSALVIRIEPRSSAKAVLERLQYMRHGIDSGPTETDYGSYEFSFRDPDAYVIVVAGRDPSPQSS